MISQWEALLKPIGPFVVTVTALLTVEHWGLSTVCAEDFLFLLRVYLAEALLCG